MSQELTEILIGKYLDSEITPAEQQLLDRALKDDPDARRLLMEMEQLHEQAKRALAQEITDKGDSAEVIFERAWQQKKMQVFWKVKLSRLSRTAATLAAGFFLGLGVYYFAGQIPGPIDSPALVVTHTPTPPPGHTIADNTNDEKQPKMPRAWQEADPTRMPQRLDWYSYTDPQGRQWLIEAPRNNAVTSANYDGTL